MASQKILVRIRTLWATKKDGSIHQDDMHTMAVRQWQSDTYHPPHQLPVERPATFKEKKEKKNNRFHLKCKIIK